VHAGAEILVAGSAIFEHGSPRESTSKLLNPPAPLQTNGFKISSSVGEAPEGAASAFRGWAPFIYPLCVGLL